MIQAIFDQEALDKLPLIKSILKNVESFEANQIRNYTLQKLSNSKVPLSKMSDNEIRKFSLDLLEIFKNKNWIK